jgi:SPP1 family predicted phage head-tail adaptor
MIFNKTCFLVSENDSGETDDDGNMIVNTTYRKVFCAIKSIPQNEYFLCGQSNIRASFVFEIRSSEYNQETKLKYKDKIYHIYRTYDKQNEFTDLYTEYRDGDNYE